MICIKSEQFRVQLADERMREMIKKLFGVAFIIAGIVLEVIWLGFCFGSIVIGILLLLFAPRILFFPFNFFLLLGLRLIYADAFKSFENASKQGYQRATPTSNIEEYYKELESSANDSFDTIKKNYRRLMKEHHYDSLVSKGLPADMLEYSQEKTKRLNEAYAAIKELRG